MRGILFRGVNKDYGWRYGYYTDLEDTVIWHNGYQWEIVKNTLGQFTGVYDSKGEMLFEGDLVKKVRNAIDGSIVENTYEIVFTADNTENIIGFTLNPIQYKFDDCSWQDLEKIGTVFDSKIIEWGEEE